MCHAIAQLLNKSPDIEMKRTDRAYFSKAPPWHLEAFNDDHEQNVIRDEDAEKLAIEAQHKTRPRPIKVKITRIGGH